MTAGKQHTIFNHSLVIKEHHLDTFGHVNNATYLQIFEQIRWDILESRGYGLGRIQETGLGPTILEINIRFKRELRNREKIKIETQYSHTKGKLFFIEQQIYNENSEICCSATFTMGLFDMRKRSLVSPSDEWMRAMSDGGV